MEQRINMGQVEPKAYAAILGIKKYLDTANLDPIQHELIKIRASQINQCAFCIDMHSREARKLGESEQRIYLLNAWRETNLFNAEEKAILALTEEVTLIHQGGVSSETYQNALNLFGEHDLAKLMVAIININLLNRVGVATDMGRFIVKE